MGRKIRQQNKKKLLCRKKKENTNYDSANRSNKSLRVIRATPITPNPPINRQSNKRLRKSVICDNESKENMNNINSKKYEYGNPAVLAWMQKQKKKRAEKVKLNEKRKKSEIQKRKDYISNLNKRQKQRAHKVIKRQKVCKAILSPPNHNKVIDKNDSNDMHPANILLNKLQNDIIQSPESKTVTTETHINYSDVDVVSNHSLQESVLSNVSSTKSLLDKKGNVDPMLLQQIYDCIQQNKSMRNSTANIRKSSSSSNCRSKKMKIAKKKPIKRNKSQIIVRKKQNKNQNNLKNKKISKQQKKKEKKKEEVIDESVENRLNLLKDTSSRLQQRLENIAKTLHFPNDPKPSKYFECNEIDPIECCDPNFIEPIQCQKEINRVNSIFDKLQKQIEINDDEQKHEDKIFNIYAKDLMYNTNENVENEPIDAFVQTED